MNDLSQNPTAVALPRLSRNEAQARTSIAQRGGALALTLGGIAWQADLVPLAAPINPQPEDWLLDIEWAGARLCVRLAAAAVGELAAPLLDGTSLAQLPPELAQAILEAALADLFTALRALGRGEPSLLQAAAGGSPPAGCHHAVQALLRQEDGAAALAATLHADSLGLLLMAGLLAKRPPRPAAPDGAWPLRLPAEIGCTRLTADELTLLGPGDVVLLAVSHIAEQRTLWLSMDGEHGLRVQLPPPSSSDPQEAPAAPALVVTHAWSALMPNPEPSATEPSATDTPLATLDALPVRLSFDLGDITLTLAQARALQPGHTLELARPLSGGVRIRANGALIGEGDLVEIDGQLGVSVRTLSTRAN